MEHPGRTAPSSRTAPFYSIPPRRLVCVEHPAVIKDVDKAIDTLHGNTGVAKVTPTHLSVQL